MDAGTQRSRRRTDLGDKGNASKAGKKRTTAKKSTSAERSVSKGRSVSRGRPSRASKPVKPRGKSRSVSRKSDNRATTTKIEAPVLRDRSKSRSRTDSAKGENLSSSVTSNTTPPSPVRRTPTRASTSTPQRSNTPTRSSTTTANNRKAPKLCSLFKAGYLRFSSHNIVCIAIASLLLIGFLIIVNNKSLVDNISQYWNLAIEKIIKTYEIKKSS